MKILRITSLGYESGGTENGIVLLTPVLEAMGHTVKILSSDASPEQPHFSDFEFSALERHPFILRLLYKAFYPHAYIALKKVLKEFQPDLVQLHTMYAVSPSVLFLLRKYPTVVTVHGAEEYTAHLLTWTYPRNFFKEGVEEFEPENLNWRGRLHYIYNRYIVRPIYRYVFKHVDTFLVMSSYMKEKLKEDGIESVCIPNATQLFSPKVIRVDGRHIVYVGRLEKIKGVQYAIQACALVTKQFPNTTFTIVGTGEYKGELEKLVRELHIEKQVAFVGTKSRSEVEKLYEQATVVVVPSVWPEPFGKVGIEAMSVGRPVIASNVGGIGEWLKDTQTGFLVPPKDAEALAQKICALFIDKKLLIGMSEKAVIHAQQFSIEMYAKRVIALYETILERYKKDFK